MNVHDEVLAIGSLAQAVIDQGIPAVLGMRYSVYVVTAAQYIGQLYAALAKGRPFGEAASQGRKHLAANPERWVGLEPRPLQDWFVPVVYEAMPIDLLPPAAAAAAWRWTGAPSWTPCSANPALRRYVPDTGFVGRDETLLLLDRAFDAHPVVLLHAYAGQGKSATAVEFSRWYAMTGGLGAQPVVLLTSFEQPTDLSDALNQVGQLFGPLLQANGIEWHALNDTAARRDLVVQILRQIPVLWIWDNVEPVAGFPAGSESQWTAAEQAELADFLKQIKLDRATQAKILLTSRRDEQGWLGGLPKRIAMPRMSAADAAALAVQIGTERGLDRRQIGQWRPLLDYCAGNPLTLRVIAGQAVRQGLRTQGADRRLHPGRARRRAADPGRRRQAPGPRPLAGRLAGLRLPPRLPARRAAHHRPAPPVPGHGGCGCARPDGQVATTPCPNSKGKTKEQLTGLLDRAAEAGLLTHLAHHPRTTPSTPPCPGTCASCSPATTTGRMAAPAPKPRCAPGSRPWASWATTITTNTTTATGA